MAAKSNPAALLLGLLVAFAPAWAEAAKPEAPAATEPNEADQLAIARVLFRDGFYDRAAAVLENVDPDAEAVEAGEYWLLRGLVELNLSRFGPAADYLLAAQSAGNTAPKIYLLRARALIGAERLEEAVRILERAPEDVKAIPQSYLLHAQTLYRLERKQAAYAVLDAGFARFPDEENMERQRMFLLMELGLYQAAAEAVQAFFARRESKPEDHIALAEALRRGGQAARARQLLEEANLRFPNHPDIRTQLAVTYLDLGQPVVAAEVLRPLAWLDSERAMHTAELYRKGGAYGRAVRMNQRVEDQKAKFRQRLSLFLEQEQFELAANLYPRVARLGLLEEQSIVYAMAYAFFQTRDFERAETLLAQLTDQKMFEQGIAIRRAIETCRQAAWQCD